MAWYVLYTKSRNEKKLAGLLQDRGVNVFCPVQEEIKQWSDRKKKILEPVFRSFIFVQLNNYEEESIDVLMFRGAVRFLWWQGKPGVVQEREIQLIKDFLNNYRNVTSEVKINVGQKVNVVEGPLKENNGTVLSVKGNKVTLHLKSLGLNLVAQLPVNVLAPVV